MVSAPLLRSVKAAAYINKPIHGDYDIVAEAEAITAEAADRDLALV